MDGHWLGTGHYKGCLSLRDQSPFPEFLAVTAVTQLFGAFSTTECPTESGVPHGQSMKLGS